MRRSKLFIFISILTIIFLFSTAALIDRCSIFSESETDKEDVKEAGEEIIEEEKIQEETIKDTNYEDTTDTTKEETEENEEPKDEEPQKEVQAPTIDLLIYEGPTYSEDDDVCYFRIEAIVAGTPTPTVVFSRDDSGGAWGPFKTQINLNDPSDIYTLTGTATNLGGTATDSLELSWGCSPVTRDANNDPIAYDINVTGGTPLYWPESKYNIFAAVTDPDGDDLTYEWSVSGGYVDDIHNNPTVWHTPNTPGSYSLTASVYDGSGGFDTITITVHLSEITYPSLFSFEFPIVVSEGGMIDRMERYGELTPLSTPYGIGDTGENIQRTAYISFDISGFTGDIVSANLSFTLSKAVGDPSQFIPLIVESVYWGPRRITLADQGSGWDICKVNGPNFSADNGNLKYELGKAFEEGKERFQIKIYFESMSTPSTDADNQPDLWLYDVDDISLKVTYHP